MNLVESFHLLQVPRTSNHNLFNAITLIDFPFAKVGVNSEGLPVVLISPVDDSIFILQKNIRLKYLELTHNLECKVSEMNNTQLQTFTVILFRSNEESLQHYFLGIAEILIKSLSTKPTQKEIVQAFGNFVEIFRTLSDPPTNTLQGLWAELFVIEMANHPSDLLNYWHIKPDEKFDFNADAEKIEVKSSSTLDRIHTFSSEQLNPPNDTQVLIASTFVRQHSDGKSIQQLVDSITAKIQNHIDLTGKLNGIICKTLGSSLEQSISIKYDYNVAKGSLRYYRHQDIVKIEEVHIPSQISEVRYKSDLTNLKPVIPHNISSGRLYCAI